MRMTAACKVAVKLLDRSGIPHWTNKAGMLGVPRGPLSQIEPKASIHAARVRFLNAEDPESVNAA